MKKIFSYTIVVFAALLLTGCASNAVSVSNDEVVKFNGGAITKTDAYNQLVATASYDTTFKVLRGLLTQVDAQLLEKDSTYTAKIKDEDINNQYNDFVKQAGDAEKAYAEMTQQIGQTITNEAEAKKALRYMALVKECVLDRGASDSEIEKAYELKYGEKVAAKYILLADKNQASELQKELVTGNVKVEDIVSQFTAFQEAQQKSQAAQSQAQPKFTFSNKYTISAVVGENEQSITKKLGIFKAEDEALLFQRSSKDTWLAPIELQNPQSGTTQAAKQYILLNPYKYSDATKQIDDSVKAEMKSEVSKSKLQSSKDVEKVLREYRKSKGFEIYDSQLKKAFDAYEKTIDAPETGASQDGATQQTAA
ncbi:MAG: hypothetical protein ACRCV7_04815 [Culicoidibacterales bacterium]